MAFQDAPASPLDSLTTVPLQTAQDMLQRSIQPIADPATYTDTTDKNAFQNNLPSFFQDTFNQLQQYSDVKAQQEQAYQAQVDAQNAAANQAAPDQSETAPPPITPGLPASPTLTSSVPATPGSVDPTSPDYAAWYNHQLKAKPDTGFFGGLMDKLGDYAEPVVKPLVEGAGKAFNALPQPAQQEITTVAHAYETVMDNTLVPVMGKLAEFSNAVTQNTLDPVVNAVLPKSWANPITDLIDTAGVMAPYALATILSGGATLPIDAMMIGAFTATGSSDAMKYLEAYKQGDLTTGQFLSGMAFATLQVAGIKQLAGRFSREAPGTALELRPGEVPPPAVGFGEPKPTAGPDPLSSAKDHINQMNDSAVQWQMSRKGNQVTVIHPETGDLVKFELDPATKVWKPVEGVEKATGEKFQVDAQGNRIRPTPPPEPETVTVVNADGTEVQVPQDQARRPVNAPEPGMVARAEGTIPSTRTPAVMPPVAAGERGAVAAPPRPDQAAPIGVSEQPQTAMDVRQGRHILTTPEGDRLDYRTTPDGAHINDVTATVEGQGRGTILLQKAIDDIRAQNPQAVITADLNSEGGARLFAHQPGVTFMDRAGNPIAPEEAARRAALPATDPEAGPSVEIHPRVEQTISETKAQTIVPEQAKQAASTPAPATEAEAPSRLNLNAIADMARVSKGGEERAVGAVDPRVLKTLGGNLYSGDLGKIAVKEMVQNSVDEIRPLGAEGALHVNVDTRAKTITVTDNGPGMSPKTAMSEFVDIGGSKKPEGASGGFGIAKVAIFANAEHIDVQTVTKVGDKLHVTKLTGSGEDWVTTGLKVTRTILPYESGMGTGTKISVTLKPDVAMNEWASRNWLATLARTNKLGVQMDLTADGVKINSPESGNGYTNAKDFTPLNDLQVPGATLQISASPESRKSSYIDVHVLNKGLPQWQKSMYLPGDFTVPRELIVDVHATHGPDQPDYPFRPDREGLRADAEEALDNYIKLNVVHEAAKAESDKLAKLFQEAPFIPSTRKGIEFRALDTGGDLNPEDVKVISTSPYVALLSDEFFIHTNTFLEKLRDFKGPVMGDARYHGIGLGREYLGININGSALFPPSTIPEPLPEVVTFRRQNDSSDPDSEVVYEIERSRLRNYLDKNGLTEADIVEVAPGIPVGGHPIQPIATVVDPFKDLRGNLILMNPYRTWKEVVADTISSSTPEELTHLIPAFASQLASIMLHEVSHVAARGHNEDFAGILTRMVGRSSRQFVEAEDSLTAALNHMVHSGEWERFVNDANTLNRHWDNSSTENLVGRASDDFEHEPGSDTGAGVPVTDGRRGPELATGVSAGGRTAVEGVPDVAAGAVSGGREPGAAAGAAAESAAPVVPAGRPERAAAVTERPSRSVAPEPPELPKAMQLSPEDRTKLETETGIKLDDKPLPLRVVGHTELSDLVPVVHAASMKDLSAMEKSGLLSPKEQDLVASEKLRRLTNEQTFAPEQITEAPTRAALKTSVQARNAMHTLTNADSIGKLNGWMRAHGFDPADFTGKDSPYWVKKVEGGRVLNTEAIRADLREKLAPEGTRYDRPLGEATGLDEGPTLGRCAIL